MTDLRLLDVVENLFTLDGKRGHEIVFVYAGSIPASAVGPEGGTFTEDDGAALHVVWRHVGDQLAESPL